MCNFLLILINLNKFRQRVKMKKNVFFTVESNNVHLYKKEKHEIDYTAKDEDGRNLLHIAIISDADIIAQDLICNGIDINATDRYGLTPLHLCAEYENYSVAEILLQKGAVVDPVDKYGNTPLWVAVFNEDYKLAQLLISYGANKDNKNLNNKSPLDFAKQTGNEDMINILSQVSINK